MNLIKYPSIDSIPIILHTKDSYSHYWDYWYYFTNKYINHKNIIFTTEQIEPSFKDKIKVFKTGYGEWGQRLINILNSIENRYIFYMQEDFWAIDNFPYTQAIINRFVDDDIDCWRISSMCNFYNLEQVDDNIFKYAQNSLYTISHQFSLWKKETLLKYILPTENPWQNELDGSYRINNSYKHKIYFQPKDWYIPTVRRGELTQVGKDMLIKEQLC